jgi:molecular chaperone GrpE
MTTAQDEHPEVSSVDPKTSTEATVETPVEATEPETAPADVAEENPMAREMALLKERHIRLMADFDNMRKRTARELEERTARANENLLKALIPVFDNFEMALTNAPEGAFTDGVKMIASEFKKVLETSGAEIIDAPEGSAFDPMIHEAMTAIPHPSHPEGTVVNQFRKGWRLGGKIIRPAQVIVSSGAPQEA